MRKDGERLQSIQGYFRALADVHEAGTCPPLLSKISNAQHILDLTNEYARTPSARLVKIGISDASLFEKARADLKNLKTPPPDADPRDVLIREAEEALVGRCPDGFFPTPTSVSDRLLDYADLQPGLRMLEPSAGKGDLAEAMRSREPNASLEVCEIIGELDTILRLKGLNVVGHDFLQVTGQWDRIVMNPPFEKGQDIDHVLHAYECLAPGGILVSVMSAGPFYRSDNKAEGFRSWLAGEGGLVEDLGPGAFKKAFRSTGVNTKFVVIHKP
jgi:hypothetical protein